MSATDGIGQQLTEAYTAYADDLYRFAFARTLDRDDAWDLVQDAFVNMHRYLKNGYTVGNNRVFLFQVVNNLIIDRARSRKRREDQVISLDSLQEIGVEFEANEEVRKTVQKRLEANRILEIARKHCSSDDYNLFVMRHINGLMPADISQVTGLSVNRVSVRLHRMNKEVFSAVKFQQAKRGKQQNSFMRKQIEKLKRPAKIG